MKKNLSSSTAPLDAKTSFHPFNLSTFQPCQSSIFGRYPLVVGVLHSEACLKNLACEEKNLSMARIDLLEARLDSLPQGSLPQQWPLPVIATARHPAEGGHGNLSLQQRRDLLEKALEWATAIDVELRSAKELAPTISQAHSHKCSIILSFHDFETVPSVKRLQELATRAEDAGATLFKVAATVQSEQELARLMAFQQSTTHFPVATMGMGSEGKRSRLILAKLGTALSYGWLYYPQLTTSSSPQYSAWELSHALRNSDSQQSQPLS